MIESSINVEPTISDDPKLYDYEPGNAPEDVVINIGNSPLMIAAPHAVNDPQRIEVGDRRRGAYYPTCVGKMPGLMPLARVDGKRLAEVNKLRAIRIGDREPDWVTAARKKSADDPDGQQAIPFNPHSDKTPLQRAAQGI